MAEVKGVQLKAALMFLRVRYGEQAVNEAIDLLSPADRALLPPLLLDSNWYPNSVWRAVRRVSRMLMRDTETGGDDFPFELGKYLAQYAFTGVYKSLLEKTPIKQIEKFSSIKDFFSRDTRDVETKMLSNASCLVRYHYEKGAQVTRSTCVSSKGFWVRTLELTGASDVKATHPKCVIDGKNYCEFLFEWQ